MGTFKINNQQVRQLYFAFPPVEEQQEILDWLSRELTIVGAVWQQAEQEISLLREYFTRLIADVVTGKLDVREAAASLSEETEAAPEDTEALAGDEKT